jgi:type IV secretion system protein VirB2
MKSIRWRLDARLCWSLLGVIAVLMLPELALAQASPFETGATNLVASFIAIGTPIAILLVMGFGVAATAGQLSWAWPIGALIGIGVIFAAPTIVTWARTLFGA